MKKALLLTFLTLFATYGFYIKFALGDSIFDEDSGQ